MGEVEVSVTLKCARCGQIGSAVWESPLPPSRHELISLSNGFYERLTMKPITSQPEIMCGDCKTPACLLTTPSLAA